MRMKPFFSYFGAKYRLAPKYPSPERTVLIEPFAGSAQYSLFHHCLDVRLYDVDPVICQLWEYLIGVSGEEILSLPDIGPDETTDDLLVCDEARILIGFWITKASAYPNRSPSAWMRRGLDVNQYWGPEIRRRIASQVNLIRHWSISCLSYEQIPDADATWFIDPPYVGMGHRYRHGNRGIDYSGLASWCRSRSGQVMVCENVGADWLPFESFAEAKGSRRRSKEVLWRNI